MKSLLSRCAWWRTIGLMIHDHQVALSVIASTPRGRREIFSQIQYYDEECLGTVLEKMLQPWISRGQGKRARVKTWVQVAVSESQVFQAMVPITTANRSAPPQNFFLQAVGVTNVRAEERAIDLLKLELNKQPLACLAACPRNVVTGLIELLAGLGARVAIVEPSPTALFRAGVARKAPPRGSKLCVRFFLGREQAIGLLAAGGQPLLWHTFNLTSGNETAEILATYSTLWMQGRHTQISTPIDTVMVHGRPDLELKIEPAEFQKRTGARMLRCAGPDFDLASIASGVAMGEPLAEQAGLDLARDLKPPVSIRDIFPWAELLLQGALVGSVSLFLNGAAADLGTQLRATHAEVRSFAWLEDQNQDKLDAEKKTLQERVQSIQTFQRTSVDWSAQLRTIGAAAPEATVVTSVTGESEVPASGKSSVNKPKKQLVVSFATTMPEDGTMPRELDGFIAGLREESVLKRHFPLIDVSGLRAAPPTQRTGRPLAQYSIVCLPRTEPDRVIAGRKGGSH